MERSSGILMHLTSLPSDYGIGSIGNEAIKFMDKLVQAKQTYWQILPLTQPDAMYSPYASSSTYAGNIMLIDIEKMVEYGYLLSEDVAQAWNVEMQLNEKCNEINEKCDNTINYVNYAKAERIKMPLFHKAYENFFQYGNVLEYDKFYKKNKRWLSDYALYSSIKSEYNLGWYNWNEKLKNRDKEAIKEYKNEHKQNIEFYAFLQFVFYRQWSDLKKEIKKRKLKLMGDIPMYVSYDSADVWSQPKQFLLNKDLTQDKVAGVPPDYFSIDGQLWGNPIFNWEQMRKDGYKWWIDRIKHCSKLYDCIRIDHFRAFDAYWQVNADKKNARIGKWVKGEGIDFINILKASVPKLSIVAEDLGVSTKSLVKLLKESGFPGMKVIEFAFDDKNSNNPFLPHNFENNCVAYLGTHDNDTIIGWWRNLKNDIKEYVYNYTGFESDNEINRKMMKFLSRSKADVVIFAIQDVIGCDSDRRMNTPGVVGGKNWLFKLGINEFNENDIEFLAKITSLYSRKNEEIYN